MRMMFFRFLLVQWQTFKSALDLIGQIDELYLLVGLLPSFSLVSDLCIDPYHAHRSLS